MRSFFIVSALSIVASLAACGGGGEDTSLETSTPQAAPVVAAAPSAPASVPTGRGSNVFNPLSGMSAIVLPLLDMNRQILEKDPLLEEDITVFNGNVAMIKLFSPGPSICNVLSTVDAAACVMDYPRLTTPIELPQPDSDTNG